MATRGAPMGEPSRWTPCSAPGRQRVRESILVRHLGAYVRRLWRLQRIRDILRIPIQSTTRGYPGRTLLTLVRKDRR